MDDNLLDTDIECSAPTSDITIRKMLPNNSISTLGACFMTMDIKNYYLGKSFEDPKNYQYVYIPINFIPQEVINELIMMDIVH